MQNIKKHPYKNEKNVQKNFFYVETLQKKYYNGTPEVKDSEYDALVERLKKIDPDNPFFHKVGKDAHEAFAKRKHIMFMHSQNKVQENEAFLEWAQSRNYPEYLVEDKLDGISLELQYRDGVLQHAVSRGDGRIGDDLTHNVIRSNHSILLEGVQQHLKSPFSGGIRGEVIMYKSVHRKHYADFANCRNTVNGIMKRKDGVGVEYAVFVSYDACHINDDEENTYFTNEKKKLEWLKKEKFQLIRYRILSRPEEVIAYREEVQKSRQELDFEIDGLIIKPLVSNFADSQRPRPERQVAFKFDPDHAVTTLVDVVWHRSGHVYTPIAHVEPVHLAGTTVKRASLVNPDHIRKLNLKRNVQVLISKRGDIIPKIEKLISLPDDAEDLTQPPAECDLCQTLTAIEPTRVYCPNPSCLYRLRHRIDKWLLVLSLRGFGSGIVDRLFEKERIHSISDLYTLTKEELAELSRVGGILATKLLTELHSKNTLSLAQFIAGLDITGIGELVAQAIVQAGYTTIESLQQATEAELALVNGIGQKTAETLLSELRRLEDEIQSLIGKKHITIIEQKVEGTNPLVGKTFCFTGTLKSMGRTAAAALVRKAGGTVATSVQKTLTYLVTNDSHTQSTKAKKARELQVAVITEEEFLAMVHDSAGITS